MLLIAAILTFLVGLMHSWLGGKYLIAPLTRRDDLPEILGDRALTKLTLSVGWHALTLVFWMFAGLLAYLHFGGADFENLFLKTVAAAFLMLGLAALILSRGKHLSWLCFLPVSAILFYTQL